jgi:hypothetical protein
MKLLTREELDEIDLRVERAANRLFYIAKDDYELLIAAARRSIPRPISEAPRDGKMIVGRLCNGDWRVCWRGSGHAEWTDGRVSILQVVEFIPIPEPTDGTV